MRKDLTAHFAKNLLELRTARGWSQRETAEKIDSCVEAYGRLERGELLPRAQTLVKLSQALGVTTDSLLGITELESPLSPQERSEMMAFLNLPEVRRLIRILRDVSPATLEVFKSFMDATIHDVIAALKNAEKFG